MITLFIFDNEQYSRFNGGKTLFPEAVEWPTEAVCLNFYLIDKAAL